MSPWSQPRFLGYVAISRRPRQRIGHESLCYIDPHALAQRFLFWLLVLGPPADERLKRTQAKTSPTHRRSSRSPAVFF